MAAFREVLNEAGISQAEFSVLLKVSRTTVYKWASGVSNPASFVAPRVRKAVALIHKATELGLLPADTGMPNKDNRDERMMAIRAALKAATDQSADA